MVKNLTVGLAAAVLAGCVSVSPDFGSKAFETEAGSLAPHWKGPHIQGFACTPDAVYLGYQHGIFKYGWNGKLLKYVDTPCHTGDVCWYGGRLYTSVDILKGPRPMRSGVVQVYDADLNLIKVFVDESGILNESEQAVSACRSCLHDQAVGTEAQN